MVGCVGLAGQEKYIFCLSFCFFQLFCVRFVLKRGYFFSSYIIAVVAYTTRGGDKNCFQLAFQRSVWRKKIQHIFDSWCQIGHRCLEGCWRVRNSTFFIRMITSQQIWTADGCLLPPLVFICTYTYTCMYIS